MTPTELKEEMGQAFGRMYTAANLGPQELSHAIRDFEQLFNAWQLQVITACRCGRGVALPPNLRCDRCIDEWRARSAAAKRAVATKRMKYKTWPTRRGDHK